MAVVPLQYRFDGPRTAPVVVLLPTLGTRWSLWEPQLPELTRRLRVLRVNHRGHGSSPAPRGPYSVQELGGDLLALLDRCELERASFVGIGLGAMVSLWAAAAEPSRVTRLALLSTTSWAPPSLRWQSIGERVRRFGVSSVVDEVTRSWFTPGFCEQRPDIVARFTEEFEKTDPEGYAGCCDAVANVDHRSLARRVHAPTMVIAGAHDPQTPPGHGRRLAGVLPDAHFEVVGGAAHLANVERADLVNDLLLRHLAPAAVRWP
ncbi:alpha/beta fold hydrolase [Thermobifida cellulosilytica]|uniref:3-oxoadipate enol-lactonase n=1 Tax=Thermobifida cellulosilytica TB100 TaxID=665004 RepID=A0A147KM67_THECS|nr:alpha/beta fold hydrolase [Thermobifida cellulosilytica]KUP98328.1 3-oxoadipate enol-lactonase [Thermobifida cellulosilytica TB100]